MYIKDGKPHFESDAESREYYTELSDKLEKALKDVFAAEGIEYSLFNFVVILRAVVGSDGVDSSFNGFSANKNSPDDQKDTIRHLLNLIRHLRNTGRKIKDLLLMDTNPSVSREDAEKMIDEMIDELDSENKELKNNLEGLFND